MAVVARTPTISSIASLPARRTRRRAVAVAARLGGEEHPDPLLRAAAKAASIRFKESLRPDPLFIDPFAGCFIPSVTSQKHAKGHSLEAPAPCPCNYILATKFIDDKISNVVSSSNELRQIVLLTDGMDTRPYRLRWPPASIIYDISPERVFKEASQQLEGVGAKIPKACKLIHIPQESFDLQAILCKKGLNGSRPSLWILQGLPLATLQSLENIVSIFSSLAMKGCIFMGELQGLLLNSESEDMLMTVPFVFFLHLTKKDLVERLFMQYGLQFNMVGYDEVARNLQLDPSSGDHGSMLFIARQLRYSDAQMETWRFHFQRLEEEADEEGFEEL